MSTPSDSAAKVPPLGSLVARLRWRADRVRRAGFEFYSAPQVVQDALGGLAAELDEAADELERRDRG